MKKQTPFLLIIRGTSGSGKSTIAHEVAMREKAVLLGHDTFLFTMLPYKPEGKEHFTLGNKHLMDCFTNALDAKKNIVMEGVFASFDLRINRFQIAPFVRKARALHYEVIRIQLQAPYKDARDRMEKRGTIVPKVLYDKLKAALEKTSSQDEIIIDTHAISPDTILEKVYGLINSCGGVKK